MLALSIALCWVGMALDAPLWFFILVGCEVLEAALPIICKIVLKLMK